MAKVDNIIRQIRNAKAAAITENGGITANSYDNVESDAQAIIKKQIEQMKAVTPAVQETVSETPLIDTAVSNEPKREVPLGSAYLTGTAQGVSTPYAAGILARQQTQELEQPSAYNNLPGRQQTLSDPYAAVRQAQQQMQTPEREAEKARQAAEAYRKQQAQLQADEALRQKDMAEFQNWSSEDQAALQKYIMDRDRLKWNWMNGPTFENAEYNARALIEKYGLNRVKEMAESYSRTENQKNAEKVTQMAQEGAGKSGWAAAGHSLASLGASLVGATTGTFGYLNEATNSTKRYSTMDPNNVGNIFSTYSGAVRNEVAENIAGDEYDENGQQVKEGGKLREMASLGYQGIMSAGDSAMRILGSGGNAGISAALAASGAFSQTVQEASRQGATPGQAAALGVTKAGIEYMTEKLPTEKMLQLFKGTNEVGKIASVLQQAFLVEPTSEEVSLFAGVAAEAMILRDKSNQNLKIGEMVANGMSYEEAQKAFYKDLWNEAAQTYVSSMFSGLLGSGGAAIMGGNNNVATPEQMPTEAVPAAPVTPVVEPAQQTGPSAEQLLDGIQDMTPAPAPLTEEQQHFDNAAAIANGMETEAQKNAVSEETAAFTNPTYEELTAKPDIPIVEVRANSESKTYQEMKADVFNMASVGKWYDTPRINVDTGMPVFLSKNTFTHAFSNLSAEHGADTILAASNAPALIENAVLINTAPPKDSQKAETKVHTFMAAIKTENGVKPVKIIVKEYDVRKENRLPLNILNYFKKTKPTSQYHKAYDIKALEVVDIQSAENEFGASADATGSTRQPTETSTPNSTIKVADLLNLVKGDAKKYIPAQMDVKQDIASPQQVDTDSGVQMAASKDSEESAEGGQIKGTGAAERNFSGKAAYNATLSEDNAQADRRDDVRPMELPKHDVNGGNVSAVTGNVYGSKITPDELASLMEEPTARGDFTYAKITNDQATQRATDTIASAGTWENAYDIWKQSVSSGNAGAEMSARGALLLNHAAQQGNKQLWLDTLHYMQKLGTNTAQGLQAFRIIRTLNASDKIAFLRMSVDKMGADIKGKYGVDLEVGDDLIEAYENAETDEARDAALKNIQKTIADQIPSTFLDKWTALRYMNMLGNLKTNVRNIAGNIGSAAAYRVKDAIGASMEAIASKVSGGKTERTKSLFVGRDLLKACKEDFQQFRETVSGGGKYGERMTAADSFEQGIMDQKTVFKSNAKNQTAKAIGDTVMKPLEWYRRGTNWMMNNEHFGDEAFGRAAYARALAGYLQANGVNGSDLSKVDSALLDKARAYAVKEAQEATFHDNSALARIVTKGRDAFGVVGEGIMPFTKTPANVLTRAEEFSPLGLINSTVKSIQAARGEGEVTGADVVNSWAKTLTGTALFALGAAMMDQGLLSGGPDEDEEKAAFDELNGQQNYAIQLPDGTSYTVDWLTPAAMPMFMGAQFWKMLSSDQDLTFADMEQVFTSIADPMIQMSMLQSLNDSLDSIKYSENNLGQFLMNSAVSYLSQGLTNTLAGQIERSTEENRQTTYVDKDSNVPQWLQRQLGKASQKVPGWDYQQMDYRNAYGQTEENEGGLLYNMLSPGYISKEQQNALTEELSRLREVTGENVFPQTAEKTVSYTDKNGVKHTDHNLSQKELETMQKVQGQTAVKVIADMIVSKDYAALTDEQKAEAIKTAYSYAKETAEIAAVENHLGYSASWMKGIKGSEAGAIIIKTAASSLDKAADGLTDDWGHGWEDGANADALKWAYDTFSQLGKVTQANVENSLDGMTADYVEARGEGISHETFLDAAKLLEGITPQAGYANPRDVQKAEAIAGMKGISKADKTLLIRQQMSESQNENLDQMLDLGYSPEEYAGVLRIYRDIYDSDSKTKKDDFIKKLMDRYGMTRAQANAVYQIYK